MVNQNLAVIPDAWALDWYSNIKYPDNTVLHNGHPSIRLEPTGDSGNTMREINLKPTGEWPEGWDAPVKPGDHIVFKCWIKIENGRPYDPFSGARIGIDLNGVANGKRVNLHGLSGASYPQTDAGTEANYVHWGTTGWAQRIIEFIVPFDTFTYDNYGGTPIPATKVSQIGAWMQVWGPNGGDEFGNAWFADAELYINPTATPTPVMYPCPFCDLEFATEQELAAHILSVHPQPVYVCPYCNAQFATAEELAAHIVSVHPPPQTPSGVSWLIPVGILAFLGLVWLATRKTKRKR